MGQRNWQHWVPMAIVLVAGAALAGCQSWNAWLDMWRWKNGSGSGDSPTNVGLIPGVTPGASAALPRLMVYQIIMPVGGFTGRDKVWALLNEDVLDSKTAMQLRQNGLRVAQGLVTRWPEISKLLDPTGVSLQPIIIQPDGRTPLNIKTRVGVAEESVFTVDQNRQTHGRTFERCDNAFRLTIGGVRNKAALLVGLEPVVTPGTPATAPALGATHSDFAMEATLEDMQMAVALTSEQFLVLSALDPKPGSHSVGALWLSDQDRVPATETVLVFVPLPDK
jgi:hypothetical protein